MDKKIPNIAKRPYFHKIYADLISRKYPEKQPACKKLLEKSELTNIDVMKIDKIISGDLNKETIIFNQQHRSYDLQTIEHIISYKNEHQLNNLKLAEHFNLSRNTVSKWIKLYKS